MAQRIVHRRGTDTQWSQATYVLAKGEIGIEQDSDGNAKVMKIGNNYDTWDSLPNFVKPIKSIVTIPEPEASTHTISPSGDDYILVDISRSDTVIKLPAAEDCKGMEFVIKIILAGYALTIQPDGDDSIDGTTNAQMHQEYQFVRIVSDGVSGWHIVGGNVD